MAVVRKCRLNSRKVKEALRGLLLSNCWPDLGEDALHKFPLLWDRMTVVELHQDREDLSFGGGTRKGFAHPNQHMEIITRRTRTAESEEI